MEKRTPVKPGGVNNMSKYCPIMERKVTYQFCQDCDNHVCEDVDFDAKVPDVTLNGIPLDGKSLWKELFNFEE